MNLFKVIFFHLLLELSNETKAKPCEKVHLTEIELSNHLESIASTNSWDRPVKDAKRPVIVYIRMGLSGFPFIVS